MKLCKDCKNFCSGFEVCERGWKKMGVDPVNGEQLYDFSVRENARAERISWLPWHCGKNARYFEPREAKG